MVGNTGEVCKEIGKDKSELDGAVSVGKSFNMAAFGFGNKYYGSMPPLRLLRLCEFHPQLHKNRRNLPREVREATEKLILRK